jgi:hypothetical protein
MQQNRIDELEEKLSQKREENGKLKIHLVPKSILE